MVHVMHSSDDKMHGAADMIHGVADMMAEWGVVGRPG